MIAGPPPTATHPERRHILGVRIDDVTWDQALALIDGYVASGEPHHVMTPNPEFVMLARRDPAFRGLLERADLAPADGVGVRWAGRVLGQPIREVVPGSDLVERMAPAAARRGDRWFLLGAEDGVADRAGQALSRRFPGLRIAGTFGGFSAEANDEETCRVIEASAPVDVLLVAYGAPAQDMWIARNQKRLRVPVAIGVGGTLNFLAGTSRRPPSVIRRLDLIWLFRLVTEPWRWRRQRQLALFVAAVACEAIAQQLRDRR